MPGMAPPNGGLAVNRQLKEAPPPMVNAPARSDTAKLAQDGSVRPPASAPSPSPMAAAGALAAREKVPATPKSPLAPLSVDGLAQNEMPSRPNASIAQSGPELKGEFLSRTPAEEARAGSTATAGAPSPAPASVAMGVRRESQLAARKLTAIPPEGGAAPATSAPALVGGALQPTRSEPSRRESQPAPDSLVVVHVVAKPAAFRSGAFDQLLVRNGIAVEPASEKDELAKAANRPEKTGEAIHAADKADANAAGGNMDVLLVDAPEPAVVSCLATLQRDSTNYVGVEVDQPPASRERADAKAPLQKKLAVDLGQFNRGVVSEKQKILDRDQYLFYYEADKYYGARAGKLQDRFRASYDRRPQQESSQQSPEQSARTDDRGRARRISQSNREKEGANARTADGGGTAGADESLAHYGVLKWN